MYECPIDIVTLPIATEFDNNVLKVVHQTGINVDHDELLKALRYDRDQYYKGYEDGRDALPKWISVKERLPEENGKYLCFDGMYMHIYRFATNCSELDQYDFDGITGSGFCEYDREWGYTEISDVTHWMPLPEAPKGDSNG